MTSVVHKEGTKRTDRRINALLRTKLFGSLDAESLRWLADHAIEERFASGQMLFFAGGTTIGMFVVMSGTIRVFQQNEDGREQVMHVDNGGATLADVAVFDDGPYPASAVAEADAEVLIIDKEAIQALCMRTPSFALSALKLMAQRVRRHAQLISVLSFHDVSQRLALYLLAEAEKLQSGRVGRVTFQLELSNHEIATRIGSVRDVVSRALVRLQQLDLVAVRARTVTIHSPRSLKKYAHSKSKPTTDP